ncbi:MAG: NERD domain-containing protein [Methanobrevibacter sp.]|jgi:hypothetical protein|nr:NERD domain-containing protein [Candidatus Methanoflexus mossambicus]
MKTRENVISDIKKLVKEPGYIYCLSLLVCENFTIYLDDFEQLDNRNLINLNEISLLLGFLVNDKIDFTYPILENLLEMKKQSEALLSELHDFYKTLFTEKLDEEIKTNPNPEDYDRAKKEFFRKGDILSEAIFYSGTGAYDFQCSKFLDDKYKHDIQWLIDNKDFFLDKSKNIINEIKKVQNRKINEISPEQIASHNNLTKKEFKELIGEDELYSYFDRFARNVNHDTFPMKEKLIKKIQENTCNSLLDLFIIEKSNFKSEDKIDSFLKNFSLIPDDGINCTFEGIGSFNIVNARPIIQFDEKNFIIFDNFTIYESVYNSPFYWMIDDEDYIDKSLKNRGEIGEEITLNLLSIIDNCDVYKSVKVKKGRNDFTDIDVLCVSKNRAIVLQVKSKKLTELARKGDDEQLIKDFKGAIQDAYEQGKKSRKSILNNGYKFFDEDNNEIYFNNINEVYIMGIVTEDYPSLTFQSNTLLEREREDPFPLFVSIFDLDLITYFLDDADIFFDYVKKRTDYADKIVCEDEISILGMYLDSGFPEIGDKNLIIVLGYESYIGSIYLPLMDYGIHWL